MSWLKADPTGPVATLSNVPVFCNALYPSAAAAAAAPRGDIELMYSPVTGYLWNECFDPGLAAYNPTYENSLHYSPSFQRYADELSERLIDRYSLRDSKIVEIGSGEGNFLALLCERGGNCGVGYDPSFDPSRSKVVTSSRMEVLAEYYPTEQPIDAALVVCQHVLEHVTDPLALIAGVRRSLPSGGSTAVYFEVPDATYMVSELAVWDLIYEHHSYFSAPTLTEMFRRSDFEVIDVGRSFGGQYLYVEARAAATTPGLDSRADSLALTELTRAVAAFGAHLRDLVETWNSRLRAMLLDGPVAVWGAGSKGVTFLNLLDSGADVSHVVDINPNKWGLHVPGTGQQIVGPDTVADGGLAHVVVMNPLYVEEIRSQLRELGVSPAVVAVGD